MPYIVGVASSAATLARISAGRIAPCDILEIRHDLGDIARCDWLSACEQFHAQGCPVIFTVRHASEGGRWTGPEEERLALYRRALPFVSAIDIEIGSPSLQDAAQMAAVQGRALIGSFHDFDHTPSDPRLAHVVEDGRKANVSVVKIATMINVPQDVERLAAMLKHGTDVPLCLLGMGVLGVETRVTLPLAGSVLTYGYLDETSAPGQLPCDIIRERMVASSPAYRAWTESRRKPR
jgi:3-dehydroquinate dehydratase-1